VETALRLHNHVREVCDCIRESNFLELYRKLGDRKAQDQIRRANSKYYHCRFLEEDPQACDRLPRDIGSGKAGQPCPSNPFRDPKNTELFQEHQRYRYWAEEALDLLSLQELGMLPPFESLSPFEVTLLRAAVSFMRELEIEKQKEAQREWEERNRSR